MKQRDLDKFNNYLEKWQGARVFLNSYVKHDDGVDRFRIVFEKSKEREGTSITIGILFFHCVFLSGPTSWLNGNMQCQMYDLDGDSGLEIRDKTSGFILQCCGPIVAGDDEVILSFDKL